jgi:hypothetical protein
MDLYSQVKIAKFNEFPQEILEQMNKMGINECTILTQMEGMYFNIIFQNSRKNFDFCEKKVAFLSGSLAKVVSNKKTYFDSERRNFNYGAESPVFAFLYIFNETQKKESGGYDAAITYWSKKRVSIESIIKTLKKNLQQ